MPKARIMIAGPVEPDQLIEGTSHQPVAQLSYGLVDLGYEVVTVTLSPAARRVRRIHGAGLEVILVPSRTTDRRRLATFYGAERRSLMGVIESDPATVVNAHWAYEYGLAAAAAAPERSVVTLHDNPAELLRFRPSLGLLARYTMARRLTRAMNRYIAVSPHVAAEWLRMAPTSTVFVVPNAADPRWVGRGLVHQNQRLLCVGHAHPNKNLTAALDLWRALRKDAPLVKLALVGLGLEEGGTFDRDHSCSEAGVEMHGSMGHDEVLRLMRQSSFLVHPSLSEGCPLVVMEALSNELPVAFSTSAPAIAWAAGAAGVSLELSSPEVAAKQLGDVLNSPLRIRDLRASAAVEALRFSREVVAAATVERFRELRLLPAT